MGTGPAAVAAGDRRGLDFTFETTLGGNTMPALLAEAAERGIEVRLFFVGLESPKPTSSGCVSGSAPAGMTFPKPPSAAAIGTAGSTL